MSPFNKKAFLWISGRKKWNKKLRKNINSGEKWIWFHCASLGEFEDSCEVFFQIKNEFPSKKTILTLFSPSAFEILKNSELFDLITYLPLDTKSNAFQFVEIVQPELVLISRSELWLNFISELRSRKIPIFLISFSLKNDSNFIKWPFKIFYKKCINSFNLIFCQNKETQNLLNLHFNFFNTLITSNTRFERVFNQSKNKLHFPVIESFSNGCQIIILGSCLPNDEQIFLDIYKDFAKNNIKWIIVPHEIEKSILLKKLHFDKYSLFSQLNSSSNFKNIIIVDKVGILKHLYQYANFAIIGGGFDKIGIHNIIEPAVYGLPIAFGPNHRNYDEALHLLKFGGAFIYKNKYELKKLIESYVLNNGDTFLGDKIKDYVKENTFCSSKITDSILNELNLFSN